MENVDNLQLTLFDDKNEEYNSTGLIIKKTKRRKTLSINVSRAIVELNLLTLPLALVGKKKKDAGEINVFWNDSDGTQRGIRVVGSQTYGVPTYYDIKVLFGLFKLFSEQNSVIQYNFDTKRYNATNTIHFTFSDLARVMGQTTGGNNIKRLQNSIRRLSSVTLFNLQEGGIYDVERKRYIKGKSEESFGILKHKMCRYEMYDDNEKRPNLLELKDNNYVIIDDFFYNSFCQGYNKIIEYDRFLALNSDISCRILSLLEGWGGKKKVDIFRYYETFYDLIPLDNDLSVSVRNRYIRDAADELKSVGYIQGYEIEDRENGRGIRFIYDYDKYVDNKRDIYGLEKYQTIEDIMITLKENGIQEDDILKYLKIVDVEYIKALLRYFDIQMKYDKISKEKGFLIKGLTPPYYEIDKKYYNIK